MLRSGLAEDPVRDADAARSAGPGSEAESEARVVLFLGTSLTAGMGLEDPDLAYPGRIRERIREEGLPFRVVNAGVSGDTSAGGLARLDWLLRSPVDVLVLELGANDGLRGQDLGALKANLLEIVSLTRATYPDARIVLAGMEAPPNLGERYTDPFRRIFPDVASETGATLVPFLLDGVAGIPELNQADGIHPTVEGHQVIAETVWRELGPVLHGITGSP